jgi:hypothetical protein
MIFGPKPPPKSLADSSTSYKVMQEEHIERGILAWRGKYDTPEEPEGPQFEANGYGCLIKRVNLCVQKDPATTS